MNLYETSHLTCDGIFIEGIRPGQYPCGENRGFQRLYLTALPVTAIALFMVKLRFMKKVLLVFCLFLVGTVFVVYWMNQPGKPFPETPSQVVEKYIHALKVNDLPTARSCWSFKESSSAMSALVPNLNSVALSIIIKVEQTMAARSEYKILGQNKAGNAVIIQVERTYLQDKKTVVFPVRMIPVNGRWKISKWGG